jgi:hypothetical protein
MLFISYLAPISRFHIWELLLLLCIHSFLSLDICLPKFICIIHTSFIWIIIFLTYLLNMAMVGFSNYWGGCKTFTSQRGPYNFVCWQIFRGWTTFSETTFRKPSNINMAGIWKLQFTFYFMLRTRELFVARRPVKFCTLKDHGHTYNFYLNLYFLWQSFLIWRYFKILRLYCDIHRTTMCKIL